MSGRGAHAVSVALVTEAADCDAAPLVVACAATPGEGPNHGVGIQNHRQLVAQLLTSRNVALVPTHGPQIFVHPRHPRESAANWLARVLRVIVNEVVGPQDCTHVVLEAITQLTGATVSLVRRSHAVGDCDLSNARLLMADADSAWLLHGLPPDPGLDPLLATLAFALARRPRSDPCAVQRELAVAVAAGDPHSFVRAIARTCGGRVRLRLASGDVVAEHTTPTPGSLVQELVVRSDGAICGTVEIRRATRQIDPDQLTPLAGALLSMVEAGRSREELENEVAVLNCLVDLVDPPSTAIGSAARRLVVITSAPGTSRWALAALRERVWSAAKDVPAMKSLAIACTPDQRLIGVYADPDCGVTEHRRAWERVLGKADPSHQLHALVSTPIRRHAEVRRNVRALERLGEWCAAEDSAASTCCATIADEVGPLWSALDVWPVDRVGPYVDSILGSLVDDDRFGGELTDTLHAYLQSNGSLRAASDRLHLHSSTVKYRMRILRDQLGDRLTDPEQRFQLELALRLHLARRATQKASAEE